jgi:hypothetical protein
MARLLLDGHRDAIRRYEPARPCMCLRRAEDAELVALEIEHRRDEYDGWPRLVVFCMKRVGLCDRTSGQANGGLRRDRRVAERSETPLLPARA